jgi:hypothetical protein
MMAGGRQLGTESVVDAPRGRKRHLCAIKATMSACAYDRESARERYGDNVRVFLIYS